MKKAKKAKTESRQTETVSSAETLTQSPSVTKATEAAVGETVPPATGADEASQQSPLIAAVTKAVNEARLAPMFVIQDASKEPLSKEAYIWMTNTDSIPRSGFAPIRFVGWETIKRVAEVLGREITLEEAMVMVMVDGETVTCPINKTPFQPVKYWPFAPRSLAKDIADGKSLQQVEVPHCGAFFLEKSGNIVALSGSVYGPNGYDYSYSSPMVMAAKAVATKIKRLVSDSKKGSERRFVWGRPLAFMQDRLAQKDSRKARTKQMEAEVNDMFGVVPKPLNRLNDNAALAAFKGGLSPTP